MCRITALLPSTSEVPLFPADAYLEHLSRLMAFRPHASHDLETLERALLVLREARRHGYRLVSRAGCLALHLEDSLVDRLRAAALMLRRWSGELGAAARGAGAADREHGALLHEIIAGAEDLVWQIERDALGGLQGARELLGGSETSVESLARAWQLGVILNSLGRLEVRGRDAAGLAIHARFPDRGALSGCLAAAGARRRGRPSSSRHGHGIVLHPDDSERTLLLLHGAGGDAAASGSSVRSLRERLAGDPLLQAVLREPGTAIQAFAHVGGGADGGIGVIGFQSAGALPRAAGRGLAAAHGSLVTVLAGDVANREELLRRRAPELDPETVSAATLVSIAVDAWRRQGRSLEEAFRAALDELEGSLAVALMAAERPGELFLGQKGRGQELYVGFAGDAVSVASELRGVVELTQDHLRLEGEKLPGGEMLVLAAGDDGVTIRRRERGGEGEVPPDRRKRAGLTTRDIDRVDDLRARPGEPSGTPLATGEPGHGRLEAAADGARQLVL